MHRVAIGARCRARYAGATWRRDACTTGKGCKDHQRIMTGSRSAQEIHRKAQSDDDEAGALQDAERTNGSSRATIWLLEGSKQDCGDGDQGKRVEAGGMFVRIDHGIPPSEGQRETVCGVKRKDRISVTAIAAIPLASAQPRWPLPGRIPAPAKSNKKRQCHHGGPLQF